MQYCVPIWVQKKREGCFFARSPIMAASKAIRSGFIFTVLLISLSFGLDLEPEQTTAVLPQHNHLDVFVMSYCPFAQAAEAGLLNYLNAMPAGQSFEIEIHYIFYKTIQDGTIVYTCLHGEKEVQENLVQMMIRDLAPEYFHLYLLARIGSRAPWQELAAGVGLTQAEIEHIQTAIELLRDELIEREYAVTTQTYKIYDGSPAYVWNGERIKNLTDIGVFKDLQFEFLGVRCSPDGVYDPNPKTEQERQEMHQRTAQQTRLHQSEQPPAAELYRDVSETVKNELLLKIKEPQPHRFRGLEIGDLLVFHSQRYIGQAEVEKDQIVYHFDRQTSEHKNTIRHWRSDLPDTLPPIISIHEAMAKVQHPDGARLVYISPDSDIFPLDPIPSNPCWVVRNLGEGGLELIVIDAVTGQELGFGIAPPATAYSMTGPTDYNPCSGNWNEWADSARDWFNTMGYSTDRITWPSRANIQSHIQSSSIALFYELAHGGSTYFSSGCQSNGNFYENTYASDIETWITAYSKMRFTFVGSCEGLCNTGDNTFAYEFSKGSTNDTVAVGYCHMDATYCETCWSNSIAWQNKLFERMNAGDTIRQAFNAANAAYPACVGNASGDCTRFYGDTALKAKPLLKREPDCGDTVTGDVLLSRNLYCAGNGLIVGDNDLTIDCQGHLIDGNGTGIGIVNNGYDNVTIKNCTIREFGTGIYLYGAADYNKLEYNTVYSNTGHGISLNNSWWTDINQNNVHSNSYNGLYLYNSKYAEVIDNDFTSNGWHGLQIMPQEGISGSGGNNTFEINYLYGNSWSGAGINTSSNTFTGDRANSNKAYGFHITDSTGNTFTDCDAMSNVDGFYIANAANTTITSTIPNNTDIWYNIDYGVYIANSTNTVVEKSHLYNTAETEDSETDTAISISNSSGTVIRSNTLGFNERGVYVNNSDGTAIQNNVFGNTETVDILLLNSDTCSITGNAMDNNTGSGIQLHSSHNNSIQNNTINNSTYYGFYLNGSTLNTYIGNTVTRSGSYGVYAIGGSNSNDFTGNFFSMNNRGIFISGSIGNEFTGNTVCSSVYQDFYIASEAIGTTTGNNNICDSVYNYADIGQVYGCDTMCSGCRRLEDELVITANTTVCPETYNITDAGTLGIVRFGAGGITLDGNGAVLIGPSADTGYGIISNGYDNVTIKNLTVKNYFILIDGRDGENIQVLNNRLDNAAAGIRFWGVNYGKMLNNCITGVNQYGAVVTSSSTACKLIYNTIADSPSIGAVFCGNGSSALLANSILWNNTGWQIMMNTASGPSQLDVSYCDIEGGTSDVSIGSGCTLNWGWGIIAVNPLFAGSGDYHLQSQAGRWNPLTSSWTADTFTSRAIDAGNPGMSLSNEPVHRPNLRVNLGAYGNTAQASKTPLGWSLLTDINNNGTVNLADFVCFSSQWLRNDTYDLPSDFTRDSVVSLSDLLYMTKEWLLQTAWH